MHIYHFICLKKKKNNVLLSNTDIKIMFKKKSHIHLFFFKKKLFILLFKGLSLFGFLIFLVQKCPPIPLCLSRDKIKRQSGKYTTLTPTKTLLKNRVTLLLIFKLLYSLISLITCASMWWGFFYFVLVVLCFSKTKICVFILLYIIFILRI